MMFQAITVTSTSLLFAGSVFLACNSMFAMGTFWLPGKILPELGALGSNHHVVTFLLCPNMLCG